MILYLYSTLGCHLCEEAKAIMVPCLQLYKITLIEVDIADTPELLTRYGIRIPVVKWRDNEQELAWPFDLEQFTHFCVSQCGAKSGV